MAAYANILVHQGADFLTVLTVEEDTTESFSLDGFTLKGQIRKTWSSSVAYDIELSIADAEKGIINFTVPKEETLKMRPGRYLYDVYAQSSNGSRTFKIIEGILTLEPRITRLEENGN